MYKLKKINFETDTDSIQPQFQKILGRGNFFQYELKNPQSISM